MHWFVFLWQYQHDSLAVVSCSLQFLARSLSEVPDFSSTSLSLFLRQTFFYSACSWPLFVQSFLPHPHLLLFLSSACSSPVPLSSLCTAVECIWVLVGSPAHTASQIPGLAALHPGCCTHATHHHRQKGEGNEVQYFGEPPGCAIFLSYGVAKDYYSTCICSWKINMETVKSVFTQSIVHVWWSLLVYSVWKKLLRQQMLKCFSL